MFNPFLDLDEMSDDDLLEKINEIANKVSSARRSNMSHNLIQQMEIMYHQLNTAYQERIMLKNTKKDTTIVEVGSIGGDDNE
jgi:hypothetical protein